MQRLTSLWKNTDKNGRPYMRGYFQDQIILIYPNGYKKAENEPDFIAYTAEKPKKQEDANAPGGQVNTNFRANTQQAPAQQQPVAQQPMQQQPMQQAQRVDDIPF